MTLVCLHMPHMGIEELLLCMIFLLDFPLRLANGHGTDLRNGFGGIVTGLLSMVARLNARSMVIEL